MRKYIALELLSILLGSCSNDKEENFDDAIIIDIDALANNNEIPK